MSALETHAAQTDALLKVENLGKTYAVGASPVSRLLGQAPAAVAALRGVSFRIPAGATLSLVGESGCGKSTAARCIAGLLDPTEGAVLYKGVDIRHIAHGRHLYRREIQMIFQDPYGSLNPRWRVGHIIADPINALRMSTTKKEIAETVSHLLESVGLAAADADKFPHEFSGGQRQRIAVARALATRPAFLICDEPTSALDVSVQSQILNLMRDLQDELGLTYLFISHNLAVVDHMSDMVGVMYLGRIVELADRESLFRHPRHPYTRQLMQAMPSLAEIGALPQPMAGEAPNPLSPPTGCAFHPRCPFATERCKVEEPALRMIDGGKSACHKLEDIG